MNKVKFVFPVYVVFLWAVFFIVQAYGAIPQWSWEKSLELKKEQVYSANFDLGNVQKKLEFRWTLFKNQGLVLHIRYDKFNHQVVLYKDYQRNAFRIPLARGDNTLKDDPQLLLYFKDFADKKAHLKLYIEGLGVSVLDENLSQGVD
ncbi:hypothetical protein Hc94105_0941 [Helicobacter cinaedi]|uniref:hypothetical protein n=1 Tax=Helicobacter cinaedi TaxID=213 RepID=UPI001F473BAA|nr:hypothetical protein [Helicobacter cinaedi]BDB66740.1 hypothetical protein Hc94105_0941 [Helicobacter cinaedi]